MYVCSTCHHGSPVKLGKCPSCGSFGTFMLDPTHTKSIIKSSKHTLQTWHDLRQHSPSLGLKASSVLRPIQDKEFCRIFQQGIKQGWMYLLGGEPGIGKSTVTLQIIYELITHSPTLRICYITGEEQESQVMERRQRITSTNSSLIIFQSTHIEDIATTIASREYDIVVIDSIQTVYSTGLEASAGSPQQVRYCAEKLSEVTKQSATTCFIVWHVTKGWEIAWPKYLEHIVDVVLSIEGDRYGHLRFLKSLKNRFGHTEDTAVFEMTNQGLRAVHDLTSHVLSNHHIGSPGTVLSIWLDNGRPILVTVEVLLNKVYGKYPERNVVWCDPKRVNLVVAILEKYLKINLAAFDLFVNIPGEWKLYESWLDLALAAAIWSQAKNKSLDPHLVRVGELGLAGQVSPTKLHPKRLRELPAGYTIIDRKSMKSITQLSEY